MSGNKKVKDKEVFLFNYVTGEFDLALKFNASRLVTTNDNINGRPLMTVDPVTNELVPTGPLPVTDDEGNMIVADDVHNLLPGEMEE